MSIMAVMTEANAVIREGWKVLVEQMGLQKATQFVVLLERGKGDTIKEIADYWGDANMEEIYDQVMTWKANREEGHSTQRLVTT